MKKWTLVFIAMTILFSFSACGLRTEDDTNYSINMAQFEGLGLTYQQILDKYGKELDTEIYTFDGLDPWRGYCFEKDPRAFLFEGGYDFVVKKPEGTAKCIHIFNMRADSVFPELTGTVSPETLAEQYGLDYTPLPFDDIVLESYYPSFRYNGYVITISIDEPGKIEPDSEVNLMIRSDNSR